MSEPRYKLDIVASDLDDIHLYCNGATLGTAERLLLGALATVQRELLAARLAGLLGLGAGPPPWPAAPPGRGEPV